MHICIPIKFVYVRHAYNHLYLPWVDATWSTTAPREAPTPSAALNSSVLMSLATAANEKNQK